MKYLSLLHGGFPLPMFGRGKKGEGELTPRQEFCA